MHKVNEEIYEFSDFNKYSSMKPDKEINYRNIMIMLANFVDDIDKKLINFKKSKFSFNKDLSSFVVTLIPINESFCDLYFYIYKDSKIDIQIGKGFGEFLYFQEIKSISDLWKLKSTFEDLFYYTIEEEITYCNDRIIKSKYHMTIHYSNKHTEPFNFSSFFGACWFWKIKRIEKRTYNPWISK